MNDEIYEVSRNEYSGLIREMKKDCFDMEKEYQDTDTIIKLFSKKTGKLITKRIIRDNEEETYYIYDLPDNDERLSSKKIRIYELQTKEEVQNFFNILNQIQKGEKNDRIILEHQ